MHEQRSQKFDVHERVVRLCPVQEGRLIPQQQLADTLTRGPTTTTWDREKTPIYGGPQVQWRNKKSRKNKFQLTAQQNKFAVKRNVTAK